MENKTAMQQLSEAIERIKFEDSELFEHKVANVALYTVNRLITTKFLETEKQQIKDAFDAGRLNQASIHGVNFEQYYSQTYKTEQNAK